MKKFLTAFFIANLCLLLTSCGFTQKEENVVKIGFFPNITHAQAIIAYELSQQEKGWFERYLGESINIKWDIFNAGPSAIMSIASRNTDLTYVGPNPAINGYIKSAGREIRVLAGSANGGSALVVKPEITYKKPSDLIGKVIATPQYANTQDVSCKKWILDNSLKLNNGAGGDITVLPVSNPDQASLLKAGEIDAVWTVEPWVSVLELNADAKLVLFEENAITTIFTSSVAFTKKRPDLVKKLRQAHIDLTDWINKNPEEAKVLITQGLERLRKSKFPKELIDKSFARITFTAEVNKEGIEKIVDDAIACGFIKRKVDMNNFFQNFDSQTK